MQRSHTGAVYTTPATGLIGFRPVDVLSHLADGSEALTLMRNVAASGSNA
jgi:hypothetical protein